MGVLEVIIDFIFSTKLPRADRAAEGGEHAVNGLYMPLHVTFTPELFVAAEYRTSYSV